MFLISKLNVWSDATLFKFILPVLELLHLLMIILMVLSFSPLLANHNLQLSGLLWNWTHLLFHTEEKIGGVDMLKYALKLQLSKFMTKNGDTLT